MKTQPKHYNPPTQGLRTRCGLLLRKVLWTSDLRDTECNNCLRYEAQKPTEPIA